MVSDKGAAASPKRVGRPPRVTAAQIAEAALAVGLDRATIRTVAEHLGMSYQGLYHHVRTREDLLAMAAAHELGTLRLPEHDGAPLDDWLVRYARFVYEAMVGQPELIGQIMAGTVNTLRQAQHIERFLEVLDAHGRAPAEAYEAYALLMSATSGAAVSEIGRRSAEAGGHPPVVDLRRAAHALGADETPLVHGLLRGRRRRDPDPFAVVLVAVGSICG